MQSTKIIEAGLAQLAAQKVQNDILEGAVSSFKNGNALVAAGLGLGAAAVAGTIYVTNKYHQHNKKRQLREIKEIEEIRSRRLRLFAPGSTVQEIPLNSIFQFDKNDPEKAVSSNYSKQELLQLVNARSSLDISLSTYSDYISSAMQQLYTFYLVRLERKNYFARGEEDDITSAVLRYLIRMLHDHGKKFEGYSRSILILKGLQGFINEFSLLHGEGSERHSRLQSISNKITEAASELTTYSKKLSLDELIGEAWPDCEEVTRNMMINFTKLISPTESWTFIDRSWDPMLISKGIIQPEFEGGHWGTHRKAVFLLDSIFSDNLKKIAINFYNAKSNQSAGNESAEQISEYNLKLKNFTETQVLELYSVLKNKCHNFISLTSQLKKPYSANSELIPITIDTDLQNRVTILNNFSDLINQMVSCIKLFFRLSKYAKAMGELFVSNPSNGQFIFDVLLALGQLVTKNIIMLEDDFTKIETGYRNASLGTLQRDLLDNIKINLNTAKNQLGSSIDRLLKHRDIINYNKIKAQIHLDDHALLVIAHNIALAHGISHKHNIIENTCEDSLCSIARNKPGLNDKEFQIPIDKMSTSNIPPIYQINNKQEKQILEEKIQSPSNEALGISHSIKKDANFMTVINLNDIDEKFKFIHDKIELLPEEVAKSPYQLILNSLIILRDKAESLQDEKKIERQMKAAKIKEMTYNAADKLFVLLSDHRPKLDTLKTMLKEIRNTDQTLINQHSTYIGKFFKFKTDSRKKFDNLEKSCINMIKLEFHA